MEKAVLVAAKRIMLEWEHEEEESVMKVTIVFCIFDESKQRRKVFEEAPVLFLLPWHLFNLPTRNTPLHSSYQQTCSTVRRGQGSASGGCHHCTRTRSFGV